MPFDNIVVAFDNINKLPQPFILFADRLAPEVLRIFRQPSSTSGDGFPEPVWGWPVVAVPWDPDGRRDGEEDQGSGQEHTKNEEVGSNNHLVDKSHDVLCLNVL